MIRRILIFGLALYFQIFLIFEGAQHYGLIGNAIFFFLFSLGIAIFFFFDLNRKDSVKIEESKSTYTYSYPWLFALLGGLSIILSFEELRKLFLIYANPAEMSDVIPQLETQYNRFVQGVFPYSAVTEIPYKPYPVYMPMHWLPIGISKMLHIDVRWSAYFIYVVAAMFVGYYIGKQQIHILVKIISTFIPSVPLWAYVLFGQGDLMISTEIMIAAYYLILACGLLLRNHYIILLGIVLCLLSRYTLIFWLPLFAILFYVNQPFKKVIWFASAIIAAVLLIYIFPFFLRDTTILSKGVAYHNGCAVAEWAGPFYTANHGLHFAFAIKQFTGDDAEYGVYINRIIQAMVLLLTMAIGLIHYFKKKASISYYDFALAYLYIFMLVFYVFCPLTYRYYLIVLLVLTVALGLRYLFNRNQETLDISKSTSSN